MSRASSLKGFCCFMVLLSANAWGFKDSLFQAEQNGTDTLVQYDRNGVMRVGHYNMWNYDQDIRELYRRTLARISPDNVSKRIEAASSYFLGEPYVLWALGEGQKADFDQKPLYRTDAFDCTTYVSTVLALIESKNLKQFRQNILKVNYKRGQPLFVNRYHFVSADWNPGNQANGYIKDITAQLTDAYEIAVTQIDRPTWFRHLTADRIALINPAAHLGAAALLNMLHADSDQLKSVKVNLDYLPVSVLFKGSKGKPHLNEELFAKLPSGAIIEIVDTERNVKKLIGTDLDVYHMGFAIKTAQGWVFRSAALSKGNVTDIPMEKYLLGLYQKAKDKTKVGINVQQVLAPRFKATTDQANSN